MTVEDQTYLRIPLSEWASLEALVSRLGSECRRLVKENQALRRALAAREEEVRHLRTQGEEDSRKRLQLAVLLSTKDKIEERIEDLLARLDLYQIASSAGNGP